MYTAVDFPKVQPYGSQRDGPFYCVVGGAGEGEAGVIMLQAHL